ncbi:hypothetical protein D9611_004211 [Ephemerocybe angulata]|uniref:Small heat shock protein n=1 Tax=Ephemerocybe angulata TaxID=980116 RepID=A0A8H5BKM7_9AGAR|nr:hypothetical protein D9611_004211 [Tulosesus angulatus]
MAALFYEPFYDFERLIDDTLGYRMAPTSKDLSVRSKDDQNQVSRPMKPKMDLHEDSEKNLVTATFELPGLKKEDVNINVDNNRLTVSGETHQDKEYDENGYAVKERRYGTFSRTLQLPQGVQDNQIKAKMENGVLTVQFPKASTEATPKKITIE